MLTVLKSQGQTDAGVIMTPNTLPKIIFKRNVEQTQVSIRPRHLTKIFIKISRNEDAHKLMDDGARLWAKN